MFFTWPMMNLVFCKREIGDMVLFMQIMQDLSGPARGLGEGVSVLLCVLAGLMQQLGRRSMVQNYAFYRFHTFLIHKTILFPLWAHK